MKNVFRFVTLLLLEIWKHYDLIYEIAKYKFVSLLYFVLLILLVFEIEIVGKY